ncbi:aspartate kinase [Nannocystis sp. RBIL2]|nr:MULTISPECIES: aspartate kinase [unclassified Nannocystis]MCY1071283.1 aspartate kinase [Nannocystis sp. RBIL2]
MKVAPPDGDAPAVAARPLIVKKFGGTSVATVERIRNVARIALASRRTGHDVVVVVSAMSGETDRLVALAQAILPLPDGREQDVVVATGEQVTVALTALAIQAEGGEACSFVAHQLPLLTDSTFTRARIQRVERGPILDALARGRIAVVAGFQGVDEARNITTLGRGGSDTTAVAIAAALDADVCEIYTDIDGVYTADPRVCPDGQKLSAVSYEDMLELASLGAKVLQVRSVEVAMKHKVPVHVRSSFTDVEGTRIVDRQQVIEARALTGLACAPCQARVELVGLKHDPEFVVQLTHLLAERNVCVDMFRHTRRAPEDALADISFALPEEELPRSRHCLEQLVSSLGAGMLRISSGLAKVSLVGIGIHSDPGIAARLCRSLAQQDITVLDFVMHELRISCLLRGSDARRAVCALHEAFEFPARPSPSLQV